MKTVLLWVSLVALGSLALARPAPVDPLPSWQEGPTKKAILEFVREVTREGGKDFVPIPERVATFDNDGTLWVEQPLYTQALFVIDRVKALSASHPEWKEKPPFADIVANDRDAMKKWSHDDVLTLLMTTQTGISTDEYTSLVRKWFAVAKHPRFDRLYTQCVYQPQLELMNYLRASRFKVYIVTGGGVDFVRAISTEVYGVPPEQVVGSSVKTRFEIRDGRPLLVRRPELETIDDGPGKPVNIHLHIGRRPILAFGNSDGDLQMLQYTDWGPRRRLMLLVHHDDAVREYAYDRRSLVGRLDKALNEARKRNWRVVSMKDDWKTLFPPSRKAGPRHP